MPLLYGPDGTAWPHGRVKKTWQTDFDGDALPDWLTLGTDASDDGSTVGSSTTPPGGVAVTTAAVPWSTAKLQGPEIDLSGVMAVRLTVAFTRGWATGTRLRLGFPGATGGGFLYQDGGVATLIARNGGVETSMNTAYTVEGAAKRHVTSLLITADDLSIHVGDGDQVWTSQPFGASLELGIVRPAIWWTTKDGAAVTGHVHQMTVERWWR